MLDDKDLQPMRLALPQNIFVLFVKPDAPSGGHRQYIAQLGDLKRSVLFQEVRDAVADFRGVQESGGLRKGSGVGLVAY